MKILCFNYIMYISNLSILISISLFALIFMIYTNISKQLSIKSYIATTYMYILFAFLFIIFINEENLMPDLKHNIKFMTLAILSMMLLVSLSYIDPKKQMLKHLIWLSLIGILGVMLNPIYNYAKNENILNKTILTVSAMFFVMTYFAYKKPLSYFDSWKPYLISSLVGIIVSRLANIIFSDLNQPSGFLGRDLIISTITVVLFNSFLLYDTQKIIKEGIFLNKICVGKDNLICADYPVKSMSIILDILNLFTNITRIYSNN